MSLITPKDIQNKEDAEMRVCEVYRISRETFRNRSRAEEYSHPRFGAWLILRKVFLASYTLIGAMYEKDHTTIKHGVEKAIELGMVDSLGISSGTACGKPVYKLGETPRSKPDTISLSPPFPMMSPPRKDKNNQA